MNRLWCNGRWLDRGDFSVSVKDRGLLHGLGLFETILAVDGVPVLLDRHWARMAAGCERLGWKFESASLLEVMEELLRVNHLTRGRARVRLAMTGGSGGMADAARGEDALIWIVASEAPEQAGEVSVLIAPWRRNERSALAGLKCAAYAENLLALQHAKAHGADEVLFFNTSGMLCEAAMANVFLVLGGLLVTPCLASGCLPGVTRAVVLEIADQLKIPNEEREVRHHDLDQANEIILTSSTRGIVSVSKLGERSLAAGEMTAQLRAAWEGIVNGKRQQ